MNVTNLTPITLLEPITHIELKAKTMSFYIMGDTNATFLFKDILVSAKDASKLNGVLIGKGLLLIDYDKNDSQFVQWKYEGGLSVVSDITLPPTPMLQVTNDMLATGNIFNLEDSIKHYILYDTLYTKLIYDPIKMSELIEIENIKLLESANER